MKKVSRSRSLTFLAGFLGLVAVVAGVSGLARWLLPTAPTWAVLCAVAGTALAVISLGWRDLADLAANGVAGRHGWLKRGEDAEKGTAKSWEAPKRGDKR